MRRTQVTLGADEERILASRAELVRRAIRATYDRPSVEARPATLAATSGIWSDRSEDGEEHVDRIRGDVNARLKALGLD